VKVGKHMCIGEVVLCAVTALDLLLASCLTYARALLEYVIFICGCVLLVRCYHLWNSRKIRCSLSLFSMKNT